MWRWRFRLPWTAKRRMWQSANACETLLVHRDIAADFLPKLLPAMQKKHVRLLGDEATRAIIPVEAATEEDWRTEYLDYVLSIRVVDSLEAAIAPHQPLRQPPHGLHRHPR